MTKNLERKTPPLDHISDNHESCLKLGGRALLNILTSSAEKISPVRKKLSSDLDYESLGITEAEACADVKRVMDHLNSLSSRASDRRWFAGATVVLGGSDSSL